MLAKTPAKLIRDGEFCDQGVMNTLREILCQKNTVECLNRTFPACGTVNELRSQFIPHVAEVMQRVEVAAGDEHERFWSVKLTALVHEIPPTELVATLQCAGMADVASRILAILNGFGQLWRIKNKEECTLTVFTLTALPFRRDNSAQRFTLVQKGDT